MSRLWRYNWLTRLGYVAIVCDKHPGWVDQHAPYTNVLMSKGSKRKTVTLIGIWDLSALRPYKAQSGHTGGDNEQG